MINLDHRRDMEILEHLDTVRRALIARSDMINADRIADIFIRTASDILGIYTARRLADTIAKTNRSVVASIEALNTTTRIHLAVRHDTDCSCATPGVHVVRAFADESAAYEFTSNTEAGAGTYVLDVDYEPAQPNLPNSFDVDYHAIITHRILAPALPGLAQEDIVAAYPAFIAAAQAHAAAVSARQAKS